MLVLDFDDQANRKWNCFDMTDEAFLNIAWADYC